MRRSVETRARNDEPVSAQRSARRAGDLKRWRRQTARRCVVIDELASADGEAKRTAQRRAARSRYSRRRRPRTGERCGTCTVLEVPQRERSAHGGTVCEETGRPQRGQRTMRPTKARRTGMTGLDAARTCKRKEAKCKKRCRRYICEGSDGEVSLATRWRPKAARRTSVEAQKQRERCGRDAATSGEGETQGGRVVGVGVQ